MLSSEQKHKCVKQETMIVVKKPLQRWVLRTSTIIKKAG